VEITAAQDLVLLHPDGAAWASPSTTARWDSPRHSSSRCAAVVICPSIAVLASPCCGARQ
jgi:hypothetical protein